MERLPLCHVFVWFVGCFGLRHILFKCTPPALNGCAENCVIFRFAWKYTRLEWYRCAFVFKSIWRFRAFMRFKWSERTSDLCVCAFVCLLNLFQWHPKQPHGPWLKNCSIFVYVLYPHALVRSLKAKVQPKYTITKRQTKQNKTATTETTTTTVHTKSKTK